MVVGCFYFDFATRKEQTATSAGFSAEGGLSGMERVPERISLALQEQKKAAGEANRNLLVS